MFIRYNFRIKPNKEQRKTLDQWFGQGRFVWNYMLRKNMDYYEETKKFLFEYDMTYLLPGLKQQEETKWLSEIPAQCLQQKCQDLSTALKSSAKSNKNQKGFPRFKSKHRDTSGIRFPQGIKIVGSRLFIPKIKTGIKIILSRNIDYKIGATTIKKDSTGKYYASILLNVGNDFLPEKTQTIQKTIGLDLGLNEFLVTSDGETINNPRFLKKSQKKLARLQRAHSRKQKKSKNRDKARIRLAIQHKKVANQRKDFAYKTACSIAKNNDLIAVESLNIKGMVKSPYLSGSISDVSWGMFVSVLQWQCDKRGKHLVKVNRFFPSSKTCSNCGEKKENLTLATRTFICDTCEYEIDRDLNASINILKEGIRTFNNLDEYTVGTTEINACKDISVKKGPRDTNSLELGAGNF